MEVNGTPSMAMHPPVPTAHCCIGYPGREVICRGLFGERECYILHRHKKKKFLRGVTWRGKIIQRGGSVLGGEPLALYMHTKCDVSSFSHSGDTRVITDRQTEPQTSQLDLVLPPLPKKAGRSIKMTLQICCLSTDVNLMTRWRLCSATDQAYSVSLRPAWSYTIQ